MCKANKSNKSDSAIFLDPEEAAAFLRGEVKSAKYQKFAKKIEALQKEVRAKMKEHGEDNVEVYAVPVASEEKDGKEHKTDDAKKDVTEYMKAMNMLTMHSAVMAQAGSVSDAFHKIIPTYRPHLKQAKANANFWQKTLRPKLSKIVTDFIDSANEWEVMTDFMIEEAEWAREQERKVPREERPKVLETLKDELKYCFADLNDGILTKKNRIDSAIMEIGNLVKLLNQDVSNFKRDEQDTNAEIGTREDPKILQKYDEAIAAQQQRIDRDIALIVGGSIAAAVGIIGAVSIVVATGGIGIGAGVALGALAIGGGSAIAIGATDLGNAYDDLRNLMTEKETVMKDTLLLKSTVSEIQEYSSSATMASNALLSVQGTWQQFGNLLGNVGDNVERAENAERVFMLMNHLKTASKSLQDGKSKRSIVLFPKTRRFVSKDTASNSLSVLSSLTVKEFSMANLVPQVGMISYEEAIELPREDSNATLSTFDSSVTLPSFQIEGSVVFEVQEENQARIQMLEKVQMIKENRIARNLFNANFTGEHVSPMLSGMSRLVSIGMAIDQQERIYVKEVPNFVTHQQAQVKNAEQVIGTIEPLLKSTFAGLQNFANVYSVGAEIAADEPIEEISPWLMESLEQTIARFQSLKDKTSDLKDMQQRTLNKLEIDWTTARTTILDPTGKLADIAAQMDNIRSSLDSTNQKIANTVFQYGLTKFIDDLSLGLGLASAAYTTKPGELSDSDKWDLKKQSVGQLQAVGQSASNIPDVSEFTNQANSLLIRYGQLLTASMVAQSDITTIFDAYKSGRIFLENVVRQEFWIRSFIERLNLLKKNMNQALQNVVGSPREVVQKMKYATSSWDQAKKLTSAAQRSTTPEQHATVVIEVTKEQIENILGSDLDDLVQSKTFGTFAVAQAVPFAQAQAKKLAYDVYEYSTAFLASSMPDGGDDAIFKKLHEFMAGLSRRKTAMESTEDALEKENHALNVKVSQLKGELAHTEAQIVGFNRSIVSMQRELSRQERERRDKQILYDSLLVPTLGLIKIVRDLDELISQSQRKIREQYQRMSNAANEQQRLQHEMYQAERDLQEATEAASRTLTLFMLIGATINMTENAIKDPSNQRRGVIAWRMAEKGAKDIVSSIKNLW